MLSSSGKRFSLLLECEDRFVIGTLKKKKTEQMEKHIDSREKKKKTIRKERKL